eukprot:TRINITY_DN397_c1_g1_i4.p1 TRINITY_DN397_c1_g1~~TRINITY_DN397_c1_g1_i4.p1  ORF type:complete len:838 (-),score=230.32 TRINITY_DN397_c1_g1_i4:387-2900(-)
MAAIPRLLGEALAPATTAQAEAALLQARGADPVGYVSILADCMAGVAVDTGNGSPAPLDPAPRQFAGVMLAQTLEARDPQRRRALGESWLTGVPGGVREHVKGRALEALGSPLRPVFRQAAQVVAALATIELPAGAWPGLVGMLAGGVREGGEAAAREAALLALGYICEEIAEVDPDAIPAEDATAILHAIYLGMAPAEPALSVRRAGAVALLNALEFVHANFDDEGTRDRLMQALCECASFDDEELQLSAYECLVRVAQLYYDRLRVYMQALFQLTLGAIGGSNERVAMQGIEFWTTIADEEATIEMELADHAEAVAQGATGVAEPRKNELYTLGALEHLLPALLATLTKQSADTPTDDLWDTATASATCLAHVALLVGNATVAPVMAWVEGNIGSGDWRCREGAIAAFGAVLEGPDEQAMGDLVRQGIPIMVARIDDAHPHVQDSAAWALSRICEHYGNVVAGDEGLLRGVLTTAVRCLSSPSPRIASLACWMVSYLAEAISDEGSNGLSAYYQGLLVELLKVTERPDARDGQLQTAVYECLNSLVAAATEADLAHVDSLVAYTTRQLAKTAETTASGASAPAALLELARGQEAHLCALLQMLTQRLGGKIAPRANQLMELYTGILNAQAGSATADGSGSGSGSGMAPADELLTAVSTLGLVLGGEFAPYLPAFMPHLLRALAPPAGVRPAIAVIVDLAHGVGKAIGPYCDALVDTLLALLRSPATDQDARPAVLSCLGDIAFAIGGEFDPQGGSGKWCSGSGKWPMPGPCWTCLRRPPQRSTGGTARGMTRKYANTWPPCALAASRRTLASCTAWTAAASRGCSCPISKALAPW